MQPHEKRHVQATFLGLLFMYLALIVLVLLFSTRLIPDLSQGNTVQGWILILLAVFFLLFLLAMVGLNILRLFRDRYSGKPGVRFKVRLVGFFILISAVSSIPQGFLSISFLNSAVNTIFHPSLRKALEGGLSIAITYYDEKLEHLRSISRNRYAQQILARSDRGTSQAWNDLRALYPDLAAYQVFSPKGSSLFFAGNTALSIEGSAAVSAPEGVLPRETKSGGLTILRFKQVIGTDPNRPFVILSFSLPDSFDRNAERITTTLNTFTQLEQHRTRFNATVILVYSFFALPLLLLSILVSFLLSDEIIRPIVNIEEATRRVAEGDFSYRILSRSRDDLFHLAESFNRMVTELEKSRRTLVQTEKVAAWQEIAQQLAHEIKNPLTPIKLSAERLLKKYQEEKSQEDREQFERVLQS
jgi:nitrogen fixation/metabolism regulation signal transduction histidine kinase